MAEAEPVVDDPTKTAEVTDDAGAEADPKPGDGAGEKPTPGTPDKALQKVQQELGNAIREIAALKEAKEEKGALSEAQKAKLARAQERVEKIRKFVSRSDRDEIPSEMDPVAEHVLDLTDKVNEQDVLKTELQRTQERLALLENDRNWQVAREKYAGLDVNAIWDKARADALETLGEDSTHVQVNRLASRWFEERCDAAKKRLKEDPKANNKESVTSPSTYRVGSGNRAAPQLSEDEETLALARQLVREIT